MDDLIQWLQEAAKTVTYIPYGEDEDGEGGGGGGAALRLMVTKGNSEASIPPSTIISIFPIPKWPSDFTLLPVEAPWHPAGVWDEWSTPIKWTSYGPNVVCTQKATSRGYTDALLVSPHRVPRPVSHQAAAVMDWDKIPITQWHVLDGPNFAIGFIEYGVDKDGRGGRLHLPDNRVLGLLPSITQQIVAELAEKVLGMTVLRDVYTLETLLNVAEEVFVTSTTRGIKCVTRIGNFNDWSFPSEDKTRYIKKLSKLLKDYTGEGEDSE
jgi:branched-subunit amino acid aminotransferase/4-amino-4-deoxychorismate lyase